MYVDGKINPELQKARLQIDPARMPESENVVRDLEEVLKQKRESNKKKHE